MLKNVSNFGTSNQITKGMKYNLSTITNLIKVVGVINSLYLTYIYIESFLLNSNVTSLNNNFTISILSLGLIFFLLYFIYLIKLKTINFLLLLVVLAIPLFIYGLYRALFNLLQNDFDNLVITLGSIIFEAYSIAVAVGKNKSKRIGKLFNLGLLWGFSVLLAMIISGVVEKNGNLPFKDGMNVIIAATIFHFVNFLFLFHSITKLKLKK